MLSASLPICPSLPTCMRHLLIVTFSALLPMYVRKYSSISFLLWIRKLQVNPSVMPPGYRVCEKQNLNTSSCSESPRTYIYFLIFPYCPCLMVQFINVALLLTEMKSTSSIIMHFSPSARYFSSVYKSFVYYIYLFFLVNWYVNHTNL